ncbi:hypothetical protein WK24_15300 [Burkholderia vietnamiensis]|jgi:hypothetical protein|uniref:ankyrin repeat domain-containing protein n=1 Tax=Burkholderia cepacia complex TaxID=87882 RepID=UPI00075D8753|nr:MULTISPECIES: ankyrin repeat domain-containing protein [Burkholderia cepacia complex]KVR67332.1 hypothetical protein WK24_15300 [Burkholderia vietnamiensis]MCA7919438.1 ankyrin repeat domain-containing protein [Burkholderia contaminans]UUX37182.1 ankyrin repeat domain-containing protein [Burkholderia contaminans]
MPQTNASTTKPKRKRYYPNLYQAIDHRDISEVHRLLKKPDVLASINEHTGVGPNHTPLLFAASHLWFDACKAIIEAGGDPLETTRDGLNAVAIARTVQWWRPTPEQEACREQLAAYVAQWEAVKIREAVTGIEPTVPAPRRARL